MITEKTIMCCLACRRTFPNVFLEKNGNICPYCEDRRVVTATNADICLNTIISDHENIPATKIFKEVISKFNGYDSTASKIHPKQNMGYKVAVFKDASVIYWSTKEKKWSTGCS